MKKLIAVSIILVLFSGMAFAQMADGLKLGAWGWVGFVPAEFASYDESTDDHDKENDIATTMGAFWGNTYGRARLQFSGAAEKIGFAFWMQSDNGSVGVGDFAGLWTQPFDWLRIDLGKFNYDVLRGKVGQQDYHFWTMQSRDNDAIFTRFAGRPGALVSLTPLPNLYVGAKVDVPAGTSAAANVFGISATQPLSASDIWAKAQFGAGYTIDGIGLARVQYLGGTGDFTSTLQADATGKVTLASITGDTSIKNFSADLQRVEAAFALSAVENLTLDIGGKFWFSSEKKDQAIAVNYAGDAAALIAAQKNNITPTTIKETGAIGVALGANYTMGDIGIYALVDGTFGGEKEATYKLPGGTVDIKEKYTKSNTVNIHLLPSYKLGSATIGLELGFLITTADKYVTDRAAAGTDVTTDGKDTFDFGGGLWISQDLGKGFIKAGVTYTAYDAKHFKDNNNKDDVTGIFRIPIAAQFSF